jgi:hypothetical protein
MFHSLLRLPQAQAFRPAGRRALTMFVHQQGLAGPYLLTKVKKTLI